MKPRIPLTDPRFVYVSACATNVGATFAKERARIAAAKQARCAVESIQTRRVLAVFEQRRREAAEAATRG